MNYETFLRLRRLLIYIRFVCTLFILDSLITRSGTALFHLERVYGCFTRCRTTLCLRPPAPSKNYVVRFSTIFIEECIQELPVLHSVLFSGHVQVSSTLS
jgi:hypothetical protein